MTEHRADKERPPRRAIIGSSVARLQVYTKLTGNYCKIGARVPSACESTRAWERLNSSSPGLNTTAGQRLSTCWSSANSIGLVSAPIFQCLLLALPGRHTPRQKPL